MWTLRGFGIEKAGVMHGELHGNSEPDDYCRVQLQRLSESPNERHPSHWCNSADITIDGQENSVTCTISVGDVRGAFAFSIQQYPDGKLIMHTPHPEQPFGHMPIRRIREGTYEILRGYEG